MNIEITATLDLNSVISELKDKGYDVIDSSDEAIAFLLTDESNSSLLWDEKENIRVFLEQGKFKDVPNKDYFEFLKS